MGILSNNVVGELRIRISSHVYELIAFFNSTATLKNFEIPNFKLTKIYDLAYKELQKDKEASNELTLILDKESIKQEKEDIKEKFQDIEKLLNNLNLLDNWVNFKNEKIIEFEQIYDLDKHDLKKLFPIIGDRIKFEKFLSESK